MTFQPEALMQGAVFAALENFPKSDLQHQEKRRAGRIIMKIFIAWVETHHDAKCCSQYF